MRKSLLPFFLCVFPFASSFAEDHVTIFDFQTPSTSFDLLDPTSDNKQLDMPTEFDFQKEAIKMSAKKGAVTATSLRFYWNKLGISFRIYEGDTVTFSTTDKSLITKIEFTTWKYYVHVKCDDNKVLQWNHYGPDGNDPTVYAYEPSTPAESVKFIGWAGVLDDPDNLSGGAMKVTDAQNYWFTAKIYTTDASGIETVTEESAKVVTGKNEISILSDAKEIGVYTIDGVQISKNQKQVNVLPGIYVVKVDGKTQKVVVK